MTTTLTCSRYYNGTCTQPVSAASHRSGKGCRYHGVRGNGAVGPGSVPVSAAGVLSPASAEILDILDEDRIAAGEAPHPRTVHPSDELPHLTNEDGNPLAGGFHTAECDCYCGETGESRVDCEDECCEDFPNDGCEGDCASFRFDEFASVFADNFERVNKHGGWKVTQDNASWLHRSGESATVAFTANDLLDQVSLGGDANLEIVPTVDGFRITRHSHDEPMGATLTFAPGRKPRSVKAKYVRAGMVVAYKGTRSMRGGEDVDYAGKGSRVIEVATSYRGDRDYFGYRPNARAGVRIWLAGGPDAGEEYGDTYEFWVIPA